MKAYWYDNIEGDQRNPHDSGRDVPVEDLNHLGILHFECPEVENVNKLAVERGYKNRDEIKISPQDMGPEYDAKVKTFFKEHLHEDEEIRYLVEGSGYFDVRSTDDQWIRIKLERHDLMIMPAGIYHRFTTTETNYTRAMRLFREDPKWTSLNRGPETDQNSFRKDYLDSLESSAIVP